jgi:hypothetical protein
VRVDQLLHERRVGHDDVVAPQHREWLVADDLLGQQHGVAVAQGRALANHDEAGHLGRPPRLLEQVVFASLFESGLQLEERVEMVLDRALGGGGDQHHFLDA